MLVLIDNYDSFTYNLVQYFGDLGQNTCVYRNDEISSEDVLKLNPKYIVLSPGPCTPDQAGICLDLIPKASEENIPLLGICLGHQAIGQAYGGKIVRGKKPMHGKITEIIHSQSGLFKNIPSPYPVTHYHSLIVSNDSVSDELEITAQSEDGVIMAISHKSKPIHGVQFHPESIATEYGHTLLKNFLDITG